MLFATISSGTPRSVLLANAADDPGKTTAIKSRARRARIPRLKRWQPIIVTWGDAVTYQEPAHSDDDFDLPIRKSIGHFLKRTPEAITICMEDDRAHKAESDCQTVTSIPIGMIREVTVLVARPE